MRTQLFVGCHYFDGGTDNLYAFARDFLKSYFTDKAIQTHSAISFGITVCGQRMIGKIAKGNDAVTAHGIQA